MKYAWVYYESFSPATAHTPASGCNLCVTESNPLSFIRGACLMRTGGLSFVESFHHSDMRLVLAYRGEEHADRHLRSNVYGSLGQ